MSISRSRQLLYDFIWAVVAGIILLGYSMSLMYVSYYPSFLFAVIASSLSLLLLLFLSWVCFFALSSYGTDTETGIPLIIVCDIIGYLLIAWRPHRLFYHIPPVPFIAGPVIAVLCAVAGIVLSVKREKISSFFRKYRERRIKQYTVHILPFLGIQLACVAGFCLVGLFLCSKLFSGFVGIFFSILAVAITALVGYWVMQVIGAICGAVAGIALDIFLIYPFFKDLGLSAAYSMQDHIYLVLGITYMLGLILGTVIAHYKTRYVTVVGM